MNKAASGNLVQVFLWTGLSFYMTTICFKKKRRESFENEQSFLVRGCSYDISVGNWNRDAAPSACLEEMRKLRAGWSSRTALSTHTVRDAVRV